MEALLRWASPDRGLVPPGEFIPVLEESGMIIEATRGVFREDCRQACRWHAMGHELRIAVNLSPPDFRQADLAGSPIGRASCRERGGQYVEVWVVAVSSKKNTKRHSN